MLDANGSASLQNSALTVGSHTITVNYTGDENYEAMLPGILIQTVQNDSTQMTFTASANPAICGTPLTLRLQCSAMAALLPKQQLCR